MKILKFFLSVVQGNIWLCSGCGRRNGIKFDKCGGCGKIRSTLD